MWSGMGKTLTVPPPLISKSNFVFVEYISDNKPKEIPFYGFFGSYSSIYSGSRGLGSQVELLSSSSVISIKPPGDHITYTRSLNYKWLIRPDANKYNKNKITFVFNELSFTNSDSVSYTHLTLPTNREV